MVLSCCNGAGGGDYYAPNNEEVGCWITDSNNISFSDELKEGYTDSRILFNEVSKIERLEGLKEKEKEKINSINQVLAEYDKQLKVLYDLRKEQEKIYQRQQELDLKIKEQQ